MTSEDDAGTSHLLALPPELLYQVFIHLPIRDLIKNVALTCRAFSELLINEKYWIGRIRTEGDQVRLTDCELQDETFSAPRSYEAICRERRRWKSWESQKKRKALGHLGTVDALRLFRGSSGNLLCLSASRDRSIRLWDVNRIHEADIVNEEAEWSTFSKESAHSGWIWDLAICPSEDSEERPSNKFLSCSWDSLIKLWSIGSETIHEERSIRVSAASQCVIAPSLHEAFCATFNQHVFHFDFRTPDVIVGSVKHHRLPVLCLQSKGNMLYSTGEDARLVMADKRNMREPVLCVELPSYSQSMSYQFGQLVCGLQKSENAIRVLDPDDLSVLFDVQGENRAARQVFHTRGACYALAKQSLFHFMVFSPGSDAQVICDSGELTNEPAKFDYDIDSQVLVIGHGDSSITFYAPQP